MPTAFPPNTGSLGNTPLPIGGTGRTRPDAHEVTAKIISEAPSGVVPQIAPDILQDIDPGPVLGVIRDDDAFVGPDSRLTPSLVTSLQSVQGYPCVSLLLTTQPNRRMEPADVGRLERLRLSAVARLDAEGLLEREAATLAALDTLVHEASESATDSAIALFAGQGIAQAVRLPVEVEDRAVVDPTFATRDLVRALHRTPRHVVLVLSGRRAALLDGAAGRLAPAIGSRFPLELGAKDGSPRTPDNLTAAFRAVDRALGAYVRLHPAPVVVVGPQKLVTAFRSVSRNLSRLAGTVYGAFDDTAIGEISRRTRPVLNRYLNSREQAALRLLGERTAARRVASGVASAWLAARTERPEMLVVEEGYRFPARLSADGDLVTAADDVEAPDVIDDLVDELIETVLDRGGWVALARDGSLAEHAKVALTLR